MTDNFDRNIHKLTLVSPDHLRAPFPVLVHAVNRASAVKTLASFTTQFEEYRAELRDAPNWCISIPELDIVHDVTSHLKVGA